MPSYQEVHRQSITDRETFWRAKPRSSIGSRRFARCSTIRDRRSRNGSSAAG
jgi:hypothetical protein